MQYTLSSEIEFEGRALHAGVDVLAKVKPAPPNAGIVFRRIDIANSANLIPASYDRVLATDYCTQIGNDREAAVSTVEHIMAALYCCGIHNALIDLHGPELPNLDGSAKIFVNKFLCAGKVAQGIPARILKILKPVAVSNGEASAKLLPSENPEMEFTIKFSDLNIGSQFKKLELKNGNIAKELSECRTFCTTKDIFDLWRRKKGLGGTIETALIFGRREVLTPGGMRKPDECVGHKMLDAVGDLALSGGVIAGKFIGHLSGHTLTIMLLRKLFSTDGAWKIIDADKDLAPELPGEGISFKSV